ncbi:hypothetical protein SAMN06313486_10171 [Epsilonproteobacteria bacterium SCGC AD-308-P11]|jgi:hypothetical protein|nr:hypothetical protein SAMN06313486_10171 [Epsilonproteobacteria bacterium SCGC AD-308-P11]
MKHYEIPFKERAGFLETRGLKNYDVIHTDNMTRTIYKCKNEKDCFVEISFLNKAV